MFQQSSPAMHHQQSLWKITRTTLCTFLPPKNVDSNAFGCSCLVGALAIEGFDLEPSFLEHIRSRLSIKAIALRQGLLYRSKNRHTSVTWAALQIQDRSSKSRPVASLNQSQTRLTQQVLDCNATQIHIFAGGPSLTKSQSCYKRFCLNKSCVNYETSADHSCYSW